MPPKKVKITTTEEELEKELKEAGIITEDADKINFLTFEDEFNSTQFNGSDLDMLFGLIYVFKKHHNGCIPLKIKISKRMHCSLVWVLIGHVRRKKENCTCLREFSQISRNVKKEVTYNLYLFY